jgi:drug/metabolite transporter (DMT)-like permease
MIRRTEIDSFGVLALTAFALHLAFNQVVIKVTAGGFSPVFAAGVRSAGAVIVLLVWMYLRGVSLRMPRAALPWAVVSGLLFAIEFICLYNALDLTTVSRSSVIFYSMPLWLALASVVLLPDERLTRRKALGLALAFGGVVIALSDRSGGHVSWAGDLLALCAALAWGGIALLVRVTPLADVPSEQQLISQVIISAPVLLLLAPLFGPMVREVQPIHIAGMLFQIIAVGSFGYLIWFGLMKRYPANGVASFSFISPVASVVMGWLLLGERIAPTIWIALVMVAIGITLINRRARAH